MPSCCTDVPFVICKIILVFIPLLLLDCCCVCSTCSGWGCRHLLPFPSLDLSPPLSSFSLFIQPPPLSPPFDQVYSITQYFPPFHEMLLHLPAPSSAFFYIHNSSSPSLLPLSRPPITSAFFSPPLFSLSMISPPSLLFPLHLVVNLNFLLLISCYYFIFVTGTTGGTREKKNLWCGEITKFYTWQMWRNLKFLHRVILSILHIFEACTLFDKGNQAQKTRIACLHNLLPFDYLKNIRTRTNFVTGVSRCSLCPLPPPAPPPQPPQLVRCKKL